MYSLKLNVRRCQQVSQFKPTARDIMLLKLHDMII
jgi:hypothetical protein